MPEQSAGANIDLPIYLDYQSTTPLDPKVLEAMMPYLTTKFGNPHSRSHAFGWEAEEGVEKARAQVAHLIGANEKEIVFTSGATESNNLALKGVARFYRDRRDHIVTVVTEHKCVLDSCRHLEQEGNRVTYLPVQQNGILDLDVLRDAITDKTAIVSVMAVNNEIGVIQPLAEIGAICRERGAFFHTDAAQAAGKIPLDVNEMNIDLMSISGHKMYGPKGIGVLYVRRKPRVRLKALITGGGQERGMRSGTLPAPWCVGIGEACAIAEQQMGAENERLRVLSQRLYDGITNSLDEVFLNGDREQRFPGNINFSFAYVEGESLMMGIKDLAVSSGSACTSASLEPSYVLRALGVEEELAHTSLRFGIGRYTTEAEIDYAVATLKSHVNKLREMSPLWEMAQDGIDLKSIEWSDH
jgi:cysteine desulfurase